MSDKAEISASGVAPKKAGGTIRLMVNAWSGRRAIQVRAAFGRAQSWPVPCGRCGKLVQPDPPGHVGRSRWVLGHRIPRAVAPELTWVWSNFQVEHARCSNRSAQQGVQQANHAKGYAEGFADGRAAA